MSNEHLGPTFFRQKQVFFGICKVALFWTFGLLWSFFWNVAREISKCLPTIFDDSLKESCDLGRLLNSWKTHGIGNFKSGSITWLRRANNRFLSASQWFSLMLSCVIYIFREEQCVTSDCRLHFHIQLDVKWREKFHMEKSSDATREKCASACLHREVCERTDMKDFHVLDLKSENRLEKFFLFRQRCECGRV